MRRLTLSLATLLALLAGGTAAAQAGEVDGASAELIAWVLGGGAATAGAGLTALYRLLLKPHVDRIAERLEAIDGRLVTLAETDRQTDARLREVEQWFNPQILHVGVQTRQNTEVLTEIRQGVQALRGELAAVRGKVEALSQGGP